MSSVGSKRGRDEEIEGERIAPFAVYTPAGEHPIDIDQTTLHLSDQCLDAWTASWEGLSSELQDELDAALGDRLDGALYHCRHVLLQPTQRVTLHKRPAPLVTDLTPDESHAWLRRVALVRLVPGALLVAMSFWLMT